MRVNLLSRFMLYITQGSVADGEEYGVGRGEEGREGKGWDLGRYRREQQMVGSVLFFVPTVSAAWISFYRGKEEKIYTPKEVHSAGEAFMIRR